MDAGSELRRLIWESMLDADLNDRYFGELTTGYQSKDRWAKVFIAIASSTTVSGWAFWGVPGLDWIWKLASAAATLVAIALPIFDPAASMKAASRLAGAWSSILSECKLLWTQVDAASEPEGRELLQAIMAKETPLAESESSLPKHLRLVRRCRSDVWRSRGLSAE